jgi:hypothetical protein
MGTSTSRATAPAIATTAFENRMVTTLSLIKRSESNHKYCRTDNKYLDCILSIFVSPRPDYEAPTNKARAVEMSDRINRAKGICLAIAGAVLMSVAPARALDTLDRTKLSFSVTATGFISPKCWLSQDATSGTFPDVLNAGTTSTLTLTFYVYCNKAYTAALYSLNGALKYDGTTTKGFGDTLPYKATLTLPGVSSPGCSGTLSKNSGTDAKPKSNCTFTVTDGIASMTNGTIVLTVAAGTAALMAGNYTDTLTLQVTPDV